MNNKVLLIIAGVLIFLGFAQPRLNIFPNNITPSIVDNNLIIDEPKDVALKQEALKVVKLLKDGPSSRASDCLRLSSLYVDMANLIALDSEDQVISSTEDIRQANSLSGLMLRINIKGKYPKLAEAAKNVIITAIGDENVALDDTNRKKAVDAFYALAWAFKEGSK